MLDDSTGILTDSITAPDDMKFCKRLAGQEICCDESLRKSLTKKLKGKK